MFDPVSKAEPNIYADGGILRHDITIRLVNFNLVNKHIILLYKYICRSQSALYLFMRFPALASSESDAKNTQEEGIIFSCQIELSMVVFKIFFCLEILVVSKRKRNFRI